MLSKKRIVSSQADGPRSAAPPPPRAPRASGPSTDLDAIFASMSRQDARRSATASLSASFFAERQSMKRQREAAGMAHLASQLGVVRCNGSAATADPAVAAVTDEANDGVVMVSDTYEARQRSQVVQQQEASSTVVKEHALCGRQKTLAKQSHDASLVLTSQQKSRRDKTLSKIHKAFSAVGRDPDECTVCTDVTQLCVRLFLWAASHAMVCVQCDQSSSMLDCPGALLFQPASVLAPACVAFFFASENCDDYRQTLGVPAFEKIKNELQNKSAFGHHVQNPSQSRAQKTVLECLGWLLKSSEAEICKQCVKPVKLPVASEQDISRYAGIVQSAAVMGWVAPECCDAATSLMETPAFHAFQRVAAGWSADLVAMSLLVAVGADREAVNLSKLCAQAQLSLTTVERALAILRPPPVGSATA